LAGAQFAVPEAVEQLRAAPIDDAAAIVMSATDPANVFTLPMPGDASRDPFVRPRSRGALLVTIDGVVALIAERSGERILIRPETSAAVIQRAADALVGALLRRTKRDIIIETIDGQAASASPHVEAFRAAGFNRGSSGLRYYRRT
jgi:ATP-dependent helicase Lhr and Lhr-like helicase